jgi:putative phage-type endonuclease
MSKLDELNERIAQLIEEAFDETASSASDQEHYLDTLTDTEYDDFVDMVDDLFHSYMEVPEHVLQIKNPDCAHTIAAELCDAIYEPLFDAGDCNETDYDDIHEYVTEHLDAWIKRQEPHVLEDPEDGPQGGPLEGGASPPQTSTSSTIQYLLDIPQPAQRTPEWYAFRHDHLTASNIWKAFSTEAQWNSIIYEKCQPPRSYEGQVNPNSPLHWGVKYEPLTRMLYEYYNHVQVADFGCIAHDTISCLAASPDGIVVSPGPLYGRMVEIKNIVNRLIDGVPSEAYWIQMQVQMECCKLDLCDFVETRFKEYGEEEYLSDNEHEIRGFMLQYVEDRAIKYEYLPKELWDSTEEEKTAWKTAHETRICESATSSECQTLYYYLDEYSCITVRRNALWFLAATERIMELWTTILRERTEGYEHRAPKRRTLALPLQLIKLDEDGEAI